MTRDISAVWPDIATLQGGTQTLRNDAVWVDADLPWLVAAGQREEGSPAALSGGTAECLWLAGRPVSGRQLGACRGCGKRGFALFSGRFRGSGRSARAIDENVHGTVPLGTT